MKKTRALWLLVVGFVGVSTIGMYLFVANQSNYFIELPIKIGKADTPYAEVIIEGNSYLLEFDTGSKSALMLRKPLLERIRNKKLYGSGEWKNVKGDSYQAPKYLVPKVKIGGLSFQEIVIQQDDDDSIFNTTIWDPENKGRARIIESQQGSIGRPLLERVNWLLDLKRSVLIESNQKDKLKKRGYSLEDFLKVPFEVNRMGITIKAETDIGFKKFFIDTGCSQNIIKASQLQDRKCEVEERGFSFFSSSKLVIEGKNFGSTALYLYEITPELTEIDGILGMTFLNKHVLYIDFPNRLLYIRENS